MSKKALSLKEAAEYLGIEPQTLYNWRTKRIENQPKSYRMGRKIVYYQQDLDFFRDQNEEMITQDIA